MTGTGGDLYPVMRLLLPQLDKERGSYHMKVNAENFNFVIRQQSVVKPEPMVSLTTDMSIIRTKSLRYGRDIIHIAFGQRISQLLPTAKAPDCRA